MKAAHSPMVSVIIPTYNRRHTILRAIESVLAQSFTDFEILVVDDGSTDDTLETMAALTDDRIRVIRHASNRGAAAARNTGMRTARGEFIAWLDSDDEWLPDKIETQIMALKCAQTDQKICFSAYEIEEQERFRIYHPAIPDRKQLFLGCDLSPGSTLVFNRSVLDTVGLLDERLRRYEDWDWLLRACKHFRLISIGLPLTRIHYSPHRSAAHVEASALQFIRKYKDELNRMGRYGRKVMARPLFEVARYYAQEHKAAHAFSYLGKSLLTYPFHSPGAWLLLLGAWTGK
jgi:glycosyltransferase involved in cell wall biosynthesis